jgi:hypothetical protein
MFMRHLLTLILLSFICVKAIAQYNFFINPHFNFKSSFAFVDPSSLNNTEKNFLENQYFYTPYAVSESRRFMKHPNFSYGFSCGLIFKNKTRLLQIGYDNDGAFFSTKSYFRSPNSDIHHGYEISYQGIKIHRLTLDYSILISKNDKILKSWFTLGTGAFINTNGFTGTFPAYWDLPVSSNARLVKTYLQPFEERKINGFIKIGFDNDFLFKKKYIFSLNVSYIQGIGVQMY